jgi:hypothetical protein
MSEKVPAVRHTFLRHSSFVGFKRFVHAIKYVLHVIIKVINFRR